MQSPWPFTGREQITELARAVLTAGDRGVVLAGDSGVGKTRLLNELALFGASCGLRPLQLSATSSGRDIAFGPFVSALTAGADHGVLPEEPAARIVALVERLAALGGGDRILLVVDDAHLLDDPSASLLQQLCVRGLGLPLLALRERQRSPEALTALWKDGLAERIAVAPFTREELDLVVSAALGGPIDGALSRDLWETSRGEALVAQELLRSACEDDLVREEGGVWCLEPGAFLPVTARLIEMVHDDLGELSPGEERALSLLAFGEPLGLALMTTLAMADDLASLERRGLVVIQMNDRRMEMRLARPVYRAVLRQRLGVIRAREIRGHLADAVEGLGARRREDVLRLAAWRLEDPMSASWHPEDWRYRERPLFDETFERGPQSEGIVSGAVLAARGAHDLDLAERLARAGGEGAFDVQELLGGILDQLGRHDEAEHLFADLAEMCTTDEQVFLVATARARNLFWGLDDHRSAAEVLSEARHRVPEEELNGALAAVSYSMDLLAGDPHAALEGVEPLLERKTGRAFVEATIAGAGALVSLGRAEEALAVADRGLEEHRSISTLPGLSHPANHVLSRLLALCEAGRLAEAEELAQLGYRVSVDTHLRIGQAWAVIILGRVALYQGRPETAARWFVEGAALWRERDETGPRMWCHAGLALARSLSGDLEGATAALGSLDELASSPFRLDMLQLRRAQAWIRVQGGELGRGLAQLHQAADQARARGEVGMETIVLHDLARFGEARAVAPRLAELAENGQGALIPARAEHAAASAAADAEGLARAAAEFARIGAFLFAAEAGTEAAQLHGRAGNRRARAACERQAGDWLARCEGARTPAVSLAATISLTRREREVAALAARGVASRLIAERLHINIRTVGNHLQRVYDKLGVSSRAGLAEALGSGFDGNVSH